MSQQYINIGATPNDGLGDPIRTAFQKTNENFSELYANSGNGGNANTGNITFNNNSIIGNGNLNLQPDANNSGAYLNVYLTTGPDIHIAGNGENVIIGSDDSANVTVGVNGNVTIQASTGNAHTWNFNSSGSLIFPRDTSNVSTDPYLEIVGGTEPSIVSTDVSQAGPANLSIVANYINFSASTAEMSIHPDDGTITADTGVTLTSNANGNTYSWTFSDDGELTLPAGGNLVLASGVIKGDGASPAPSINGFDTISALTLSATGNVYGANISATGNINSNYVFGNGTFLTGISGAGNPSANALTGNTLTANVTISSLTQLGTLGNLSVSGNTTSGNILTAGVVSSTGNAIHGNILTAGVVSSTGNAIHGNILTAGVVSSTGNAVHGNILTGGLISATGNILATNFIGNLSNGTSRISIASGGNVSVGVGPFSTTVLNVNTSTGISVLGNVLASQSLSAGGNVYSNGNIAMVSNVARNTYVANVAPTSGQGNIGDIWYQTF